LPGSCCTGCSELQLGPQLPNQTPKLPVLNNKLISSVRFGWPGVRARPAWNQSASFIISHLSSHWIRDKTTNRKRKDYYDSLEQMD